MRRREGLSWNVCVYVNILLCVNIRAKVWEEKKCPLLIFFRRRRLWKPLSSPDCQSSTSISSSSSENSSVVWSLDEEGDCGKARCPWEVGEILGDLASPPPPCCSSMFSMLTSFCSVCGVIFFSDSTSAFISSRSRLSLALRFWNQVMTCALESPSCCAIWSRSAGERYFWYRNLFSSS